MTRPGRQRIVLSIDGASCGCSARPNSGVPLALLVLERWCEQRTKEQAMRSRSGADDPYFGADIEREKFDAKVDWEIAEKERERKQQDDMIQADIEREKFDAKMDWEIAEKERERKQQDDMI